MTCSGLLDARMTLRIIRESVDDLLWLLDARMTLKIIRESVNDLLWFVGRQNDPADHERQVYGLDVKVPVDDGHVGEHGALEEVASLVDPGALGPRTPPAPPHARLAQPLSDVLERLSLCEDLDRKYDWKAFRL